MRIVAIGDNCIDIYINLNRGFPGGGALNFAVHSARLGAEAAYIGTVGDDRYGYSIRETLQSENVDTSFLLTMKGRTAVAYIELVDGERTFKGSNSGVRKQLTVSSEIDQFLTDVNLIHTTLDGCVDNQIKKWKNQGHTISFDFSHRPTQDQLNLLPYIDIAFFSGQKVPMYEAEDYVRSYNKKGASVVVMTLGEYGSIAFDGDKLVRQKAKTISILDTLGAGDSFMAGFCFSYLKETNLKKALLLGTEVATRTCQHFGAFEHGIQLNSSVM